MKTKITLCDTCKLKDIKDSIKCKICHNYDENISYDYVFEIQDSNTDEVVTIYEDTERKAFRKAHRLFDKKRLMDRDMKIISKKILNEL